MNLRVFQCFIANIDTALYGGLMKVFVKDYLFSGKISNPLTQTGRLESASAAENIRFPVRMDVAEFFVMKRNSTCAVRKNRAGKVKSVNI